MSDFLGRLASRVLGLAPVASPVIASLLAAEAVAAPEEPEHTPLPTRRSRRPLDEDSSAVQASRARPLAPPAPRDAALSLTHTGNAHIPTRDGASLPESLPFQHPAASAAAPGPAISADALRAGRESVTVEAETSEPEVLRHSDVLPAPQTVFTFHRVSTSEERLRRIPAVADMEGDAAQASLSGSSVAPDQPHRQPDRLRHDGRTAPEETRPAVQVRTSLPVEPQVSAAKPGMRETAPAAYLPPAAALVESPLQPASQPRIEVTIGRVEVRAVHPAAPVAKPGARGTAPPRLSLDDYLRKQNGGKR